MNQKIAYINKILKPNFQSHGNIINKHSVTKKINLNIKKTIDTVNLKNKQTTTPRKISTTPPYYIVFKIAPGMRKIEVSYEVNTFRNNFANYMA